MATHSSVLAWRIPWTEKPGRLQSMGSQSRTRLKRLSKSLYSEQLMYLFWMSGTHRVFSFRGEHQTRSMPVLAEVVISKQRPASNLRTSSGLRFLSSARMWSNAFWETLRFPGWVWIPDFVSHNALARIRNSCRGNCEVVAILRTEWRLVSRFLRSRLSVPPGICLGKVSVLLSPTVLRSMQNCGIRWVNRPF